MSEGLADHTPGVTAARHPRGQATEPPRKAFTLRKQHQVTGGMETSPLIPAAHQHSGME